MDFEATNNNPHAFYRRKTMQVLEKWGVQGEVNDMNLRKAASSFARIQKKNTIMKYVTIGSIVLLAIFMGLMIASVVIGTEVTKDFKVKEQVLTTKRNGSISSPLKTSEMFYSSSLNINTPLSVIQGVKRLKFNRKTVDGKDYVFEFDVVSFYYSKGRKISLYGHTHMANILPDNSVEIFPITTVNGAKRYDTSKREEASGNDTQVITTTTTTQVDTRIQISTCEQLQAANNRVGSYLLTSNLTCTLSAPLFPSGFAGKFDGNMNELIVTMDRNGPVGLFQSLDPGAVVTELIYNGTLVGSNICGGLAVYASEGTRFDTVTNYANITCARSQDATSPVIVGAFVAISTKSKNSTTSGSIPPGGLLFSNCVSQGFLDAQGENPIQGGLYGLSTSDALPVGSSGNSAACYFINNAYNYTQFGFKSSDFVIQDTYASTRSIHKRVTVFPEDCTYYWNWNYPSDIEYMATLCSYYYWNASEGNTLNEEPNCCKGYFNSWAYNCPQRQCPNNWWVNGCNSYCATGDQANAFLWPGTCAEWLYGCKKDEQGQGVYHTAVVGGDVIPLFNRMRMPPMVARKICTTN